MELTRKTNLVFLQIYEIKKYPNNFKFYYNYNYNLVLTNANNYTQIIGGDSYPTLWISEPTMNVRTYDTILKFINSDLLSMLY